MDDHLYEKIMNYAECDLIPRFQNEYNECGVVSKCSSYKEMQDLCTALNAVAKWAGYNRRTPKSFIECL